MIAPNELDGKIFLKIYFLSVKMHFWGQNQRHLNQLKNIIFSDNIIPIQIQELVFK